VSPIRTSARPPSNLQALRDELAKLGFVRKEQTKTLPPVSAVDTRQDFCTVRPVRQMRPMRFTRLSPVQRLAQVVEEIARWLGEVFQPGQMLAHGHKDEAVVEKVEPVVAVKQTEKIEPAEALKPTETIKPALTVRETRLQREAARRKLGRGITPPGDAGHSHSHGIGV
jgi:hypothetical protein